MSVITKLFGKKKKAFTASCDISKEPVETGYGYLLTTADIVRSQRYWDNVMTEPETLSYTIQHFKDNDSTALQIRKMIFEKFSEVDRPWIISDSYISWFDVDQSEARQAAQNWWDNEGQYSLENAGKAEEILSGEVYREVREYAVMKAGQSAVQ